jgi:hypothetical protein
MTDERIVFRNTIGLIFRRSPNIQSQNASEEIRDILTGGQTVGGTWIGRIPRTDQQAASGIENQITAVVPARLPLKDWQFCSWID